MNSQSFIKSFLLLFLTLGLAANFTLAQKSNGSVKSKAETEEAKLRAALIGKWTSSEAKVEFFEDGSITINDDKFSFAIVGKLIIVETDDGQLEFPFTLKGDTLTVMFEGRKIVYTRVADDGEEETRPRANNPRGGSVRPELVGYWCYQANVNANNGGGRYSRLCFKLFPNGTYEYWSDTSNSNPYGGSTAQRTDYGRWTATANSITAYSNSGEVITYTLEKRNHPKTGDAMLMVDGDAFVTQIQRPAW